MADKLVFVIEDMNKRFILLGQNNGMEAIEGDLGGFGQEAESDITEAYAFMVTKKTTSINLLMLEVYEAT